MASLTVKSSFRCDARSPFFSFSPSGNFCPFFFLADISEPSPPGLPRPIPYHRIILAGMSCAIFFHWRLRGRSGTPSFVLSDLSVSSSDLFAAVSGLARNFFFFPLSQALSPWTRSFSFLLFCCFAPPPPPPHGHTDNQLIPSSPLSRLRIGMSLFFFISSVLSLFRFPCGRIHPPLLVWNDLFFFVWPHYESDAPTPLLPVIFFPPFPGFAGLTWLFPLGPAINCFYPSARFRSAIFPLCAPFPPWLFPPFVPIREPK